MNSPLINIITRVSRKNYFYRCYKSVHSQTYKNINHICTFENVDMKEFLLTFDNLNLVRVPNFRRIENLFYSYDHHPLTDDFVNPDWEFMNRKSHTNTEVDDSNPKHVPEVKYEKNGYFCYTYPKTMRAVFKHSPYNTYMKIAEKAVKDGWVMYLDDDDYLLDENCLQSLVDEINKFDTTTMHIVKVKIASNKIKPLQHHYDNMKCGHPFILHEIGTGNFIFHSKFLDFTVWDEWSGADYRTAKSLEKVIYNKNFTDLVLTCMISNGGSLEDLKK